MPLWYYWDFLHLNSFLKKGLISDLSLRGWNLCSVLGFYVWPLRYLPSWLPVFHRWGPPLFYELTSTPSSNFTDKKFVSTFFFFYWSHSCIDRQRCPRSTVSTAKVVKCVLRVRKALSLFVFLHLVNLVVFPSSLDSPFKVNDQQRKLHWKKLFCEYCSFISWEKKQTNLQSESVA